jgi:hypothetical protein
MPMLAAVGGRPGLRRSLVSYFFAASFCCQASSVAGVTGKILVQRLRGRSRASATNHPVGRLVSHPADIAAQHRVLVPEHQQLSCLRSVAAEHQDSQAEYLACQQVDDLEQHPASQLSPAKPPGDGPGRPLNRVFERHKTRTRPARMPRHSSMPEP